MTHLSHSLFNSPSRNVTELTRNSVTSTFWHQHYHHTYINQLLIPPLLRHHSSEAPTTDIALLLWQWEYSSTVLMASSALFQILRACRDKMHFLFKYSVIHNTITHSVKYTSNTDSIFYVTSVRFTNTAESRVSARIAQST
jgi:hypothetical protein